ncbi:MAG: hypothetical protein A3G27_17810 [Betaproteobacteria bacterium RIFCSPLOWO2_12_FULL_66_14]|nr:MAG: hypothetical protein A3G27_17810 [Betaproteobacteria bacterium RIFCSPLOWO2_12_FULL_66_14]
MTKLANLTAFSLFATLIGVGCADQAAKVTSSPETFEVTSIKAVRPTLVNTIGALEKKDIAGAKAAFEAYDSAWNGIEVYINTRNTDLYKELELNLQAKVTKALSTPDADAATIIPDVQAMLAKYEEAISMIQKAAPLNPLYDEVARLRIVRAHVREVNPALKAGDIAKARKSFTAFDDNWDSIEDLIKARSEDAYTAIEKGMIQIEQAFMPAQPDVEQVTALVNGLTQQYNAIVTQVVTDARQAK